MNNVTVCITNWRRPQMLKRCYDSVIKQGVRNIAIASFGVDTEVLAVHDYIRKSSSAKICSLTGDLGVNKLWLAAVYQANTEWVLLLHDDDFLTGDWSTTIEPLVRQHGREVGMFIWDGVKERDGKLAGVVPSLYNIRDGINDTAAVVDQLLKPGRYALSPVVALFRRDVVLRTLKECDDRFVTPEHFSDKPTMMLGNEFMLYLRSAERFSKFYYVRQPFTAYGHHPDSETVRHVEILKDDTLVKGYSKAQEYFKYNRFESYRPAPRIIHAYSHYRGDEATERRKGVAKATWQRLYERGLIMPCPTVTERTSKDLGDNRAMPFIKDIIREAVLRAAPEDIILITNDDICLSSHADMVILNTLKTRQCLYSYRRDFTELTKPIDDSEIFRGRHYVGSDLFAFTVEWWRQNHESYPDMLLGCEAWDWIMRVLMEISQSVPCSVPNLIYHEKHNSYWEHNKTTNRGQKHNRLLAKSWFRRRLGYDGSLE